MPRRQLGPTFGRRGDTAGASDRVPALPPRVAGAGFTEAPVAELSGRHARRALSERSAGNRRTRTLSRLARPRAGSRDSRRAPLTGRCPGRANSRLVLRQTALRETRTT